MSYPKSHCYEVTEVEVESRSDFENPCSFNLIFLPTEPVHSSLASPVWPRSTVHRPEAVGDWRNPRAIEFTLPFLHDRPREGRDLAKVIEVISGRVRMTGQDSDLSFLCDISP